MKKIISILKTHLRKYYNGNDAFIKQLRKQGAIVGNNVQIIDKFKFLYEPWYANLLEIEDGVIISAGVRLVSHDSSYTNIVGDLPIKYGKIVIKKNSYIGVNSIILCGVTIGENSLIGAGSIVNKNIPGNSVAAGNPIKVISTLQDGVAKYKKCIETNLNKNVYFIDLGGSYGQMKKKFGNEITSVIINKYNDFFKI